MSKLPVVERFSLPNDIAPLESVILPLASVKLPIVEPVAVEIVLENVAAWGTVIPPPSAIVIALSPSV